MQRPRKYPQELIDRGVRLVIESGRPVAHIAAEIGLPAETLRKRVRQAEADQGLRPGLPTSEEREEIKQLKREVAELRKANEDLLRAASVFFRGSRHRCSSASRGVRGLSGDFGAERGRPELFSASAGRRSAA